MYTYYLKTMILKKKVYLKTNKSIKWTYRNGRRIRGLKMVPGNVTIVKVPSCMHLKNYVHITIF